MNRLLAILLSLVAMLVLSPLAAQEYRMQGYYHQEWDVVDGDSIPHIHIKPIFVFERGIDQRRFWLLVKSVKKVYPIAQRAKEMMADMESELQALPTKKEQKAYVKTIYKELIDEYTPVLAKMTRTQGRVLLKLINRETDDTAYEIVREFRGQFLAGFWQGVSRIFGQNLKSEFGEADEDATIEKIVKYYEAGLI